MGTIKFFDDPTLKFVDDPTLKFSDDPMPTLKFWDDGGHWPTLKPIDDPKLKVIDDPIITWVEHTESIQENINWGQIPFDPSRVYGAQPFVLANPHHTMEWQKTFGDVNNPDFQMKQLEAMNAHLEQTRKQLAEQINQLDEYQKSLQKEIDRKSVV